METIIPRLTHCWSMVLRHTSWPLCW